MIFPWWVSSRPLTTLKRVLLPEPEGPRRTTNSPSWISNANWLRARMFPGYVFVILSNLTVISEREHYGSPNDPRLVSNVLASQAGSPAAGVSRSSCPCGCPGAPIQAASAGHELGGGGPQGAARRGGSGRALLASGRRLLGEL